MYKIYNPEKINKNDGWLKKYKDNPHELHIKRCNTYKITPTPEIICDIKFSDIINDQTETKEEMEFAASNGILSFKIQNSELIKAFNAKISQHKYQMCVYIEGDNYIGKGDSISLISHTRIPTENIDEKTDTKPLNDNNENENIIKSLLLMGFDETLCDEAVNKFDNLNSCVDYIISHLNKNIKSKNTVQKIKPTTVIKKGECFKFFIEPTAITKDNVEIKLTLNKPIESKISYYIYECGKEQGEPVAEFLLKKGVIEDFEDLDLDEIDDTKLFNIALYENENDTKPISNVLKLSMPGIIFVENIGFMFVLFLIVFFVIYNRY